MKEITDYVEKADWRINENANTGFSISGLKSYISSTILARDSLSRLPKRIRDAHKNGEIHIHDLDGSLYSPYCYGSDLQQLMFEGLKNPVGSMSNPAKHFDTIIDHMVNYLYMSQNEFNGAQAFSNVDTLLSGYVIGQDYNYIKQCLQRLIYNISYPLRSAFQTPFINFSFDLIPPKHMENEPVFVKGKVSTDLAYSDMQKEMDMINKAFLEIMLQGDSQGKPFTFPIPTYGIGKELLEKNDEVMNLLWQLSAKFGSPNFQNFIGSGNDPADVRSFCCRLSLDIKKLKSRGLWNMENRTGSLGVVTLNLNHASKDGEDHFIEYIDDYFNLAIEELDIKRNYIHDAFNKGLLPFTKCYLPKKDPFGTFFNTIGIHAMNEACINMFEETIEFHQDFVEEILKHLRNRTDEITEKTGTLYNLEQTPCEGSTHRLAKLDKKYGLPTQGLDNPFLTNSTHCPVNTIFDWTATVKIQEKFNKYYSGGTIMHGFTGDSILPEQAEKIIKQMSIETSIPYYNLTPTYSICEDHGRFTGKVLNCPICNRINYIYSRIVGYLQPVQKWNKGKQEEFKLRKEFKMG
jgi:ribonucleoside-triphosphate reductase